MKICKIMLAVMASLIISAPATAQINWGKVAQGAIKGVQALTVSDAQMAEYVKESVAAMDKKNPVMPENSEYTKRLRKLTEGVTSADGIPLNFKVYNVKDINAFACPDGSVRVFSSLMDIMNDDELMGIIGHEIGHVMKHHSRKAFQQSLVTSGLRDVIASSGGVVATLTESQLGTLGESLLNAKYSRKQEEEADNCGYDFLKSNGKNPWGMVMAFEKLQKLEGQGGASSNYITKMFSSHPETTARIKKMTQRCKKDGIPRPAEDATATPTK